MSDDIVFRRIKYLRGSKTTMTPKYLCCLSCDYNVCLDQDSGTGGLLSLKGCCIASCIDSDGDDVNCDFLYCTEASKAILCLKAVTSKTGCTWFFSQNLGRDLTLINFWHEVETGKFRWHKACNGKGTKAGGDEGCDGWRNGFIVISDPPTIIVGWWHGHKVVFVDARNYGIDQLPDSNCAQDKAKHVMESVLGLVDWVRRNDLGVFRYTTSAIAYEGWKHRFMRHKVLVHGNKPACQLERAAFFGGRTQLFFRGEVNAKVYQLDVNGLFPSVMKTNLYPTKLVSCSSMLGFKSVVSCADNTIARVRLTTATDSYPVRDVATGRVIYPIGTFVTALCGLDLQACISDGSADYFGMVCEYDMKDLFSDYVGYFWDMRTLSIDMGNEDSANLAKAMLTGLYGKFAQKSTRWEDRDEVHSPVKWGHWWRHGKTDLHNDLFRSLGYHTQELVEGGETAESFPAIAAFVTMYARRRMDELRRIAGPKHCYLQVIDSLYVDEQGMDNLVNAGEVAVNELGKLSVRGEETYASFYGPLDFVYGSKEVIAGIQVNRKEVKAGCYRVKEETKLTTLLSGQPNRGIRIYDVLKQVKRDEPIGRICPDGWIEPPYLEEM